MAHYEDVMRFAQADLFARIMHEGMEEDERAYWIKAARSKDLGELEDELHYALERGNFDDMAVAWFREEMGRLGTEPLARLIELLLDEARSRR